MFLHGTLIIQLQIFKTKEFIQYNEIGSNFLFTNTILSKLLATEILLVNMITNIIRYIIFTAISFNLASVIIHNLFGRLITFKDLS